MTDCMTHEASYIYYLVFHRKHLRMAGEGLPKALRNAPRREKSQTSTVLERITI